MSALPKPFDRSTFLALCQSFDRRVVDGELVMPAEGARYLDLADIAMVGSHADPSTVAGAASRACYWLDEKGIWYRPQNDWEGDTPLHALGIVHRAPGVIEPLLPFPFDAFDLAMYCASGPGWLLMDYIACHLQGVGVDVCEGAAQAVEALPLGRLRDEVVTLISEAWPAWLAGMRAVDRMAPCSLSVPSVVETDLAAAIEGETVGPVGLVEAQALVKALAELQQLGGCRALPSGTSSDVWDVCASSVEPQAALDLSLAATRSELIAAFGGLTGMNRSWFANLKDKPALDRSRVLRGQSGRHHTEPMFDVYSVFQWLISRRRRSGRPAPAPAMWAALQKDFPEVYERHRGGTSTDLVASADGDSSAHQWPGLDGLTRGIMNPGARVAARRATGKARRSPTPPSQWRHVQQSQEL